jgi:Tol biopolymer transport system component
LVALGLVLAACTSTPPPIPGAGACAKATFILANPGGLTCLDDTAKVLGRVVEVPPTAAPALPALSPDRKQVLFTLTVVDPKNGFGTDIYAVNLDGTNLHSLVAHETENVFYDTPHLDPTSTTLYFHRSAAIVRNGTYVGNESTIERLDLKTGERTRLLTEAGDPSLSFDGKLLAFVHQKDGQNDNIWIANSDGTNPHPLFKGDTWFYIQSPRFSPVSDELVFCAAGHTAPKSEGGRLPHDAHLGIPSEIFVVKADGTGLRSLAQTGDDTFPAWSLDGGRLAYISTGAFFDLSMRDSAIRTLASGNSFFFGDIAWLK